MKYRKDIDGLRAISVLSVVLNHAGVGLFSGGYIGVDIFFVISGYLITSIIFREIQSNEFSLIRFYERRIRRIIPALLGMVIFCIAACAVLYDAEKFKDFGKSVIATALFISNINFWKEAGYFDAPSQLKPLLHTWSLAVEEQFYIFYPLFMFVIYRYAKKIAPLILIGTAILSFGFAVHTTFNNPSTSFYLFHLRAWELLIGGLLALNLVHTGHGQRHSNLIGFVGLALITAPIFLYSESTRFPGISALAPVLGAALILFSGVEGKSLVSKLLSMSPLVFIGKISYSLYLWHWPLIIYARYYMIRQMSLSELAIVIILTLTVSTLSWRFVETPFRSKEFISTKQIFGFTAIGIILMVAVGGVVLHYKGFPERQEIEISKKNNRNNTGWKLTQCNVNYIDNPKEITPCKIGDMSQAPSFMVVGDSHSPTYGKAIHTAAAKQGLSGVLSYAQGCPTLLEIITEPKVGDVSCTDYNNMVLAYLKQNPDIKTVIIANRWTIWLEGTRYKQEEGPTIHLEDALYEASPDASQEFLFTLGFERTLKAISVLGRSVAVIAPLPEIGYDVPSANFIATRTGRNINKLIAPSLDEYISRNREIYRIFESLKQKYGIQVIEPWKILCTEEKCRAAINGTPLYNDDDHLSIFGSEVITPAFDPFFQSMKQSSK